MSAVSTFPTKNNSLLRLGSTIKRYKLTFLIFIFLVLNLLDYITTTVGIAKGLNELNPILSVNKDVVKLCISLCIIFASMLIFPAEKHETLKTSPSLYRIAFCVLFCVVLLYIFAVVNNILCIFSAL